MRRRVAFQLTAATQPIITSRTRTEAQRTFFSSLIVDTVITKRKIEMEC